MNNHFEGAGRRQDSMFKNGRFGKARSNPHILFTFTICVHPFNGLHHFPNKKTLVVGKYVIQIRAFALFTK